MACPKETAAAYRQEAIEKYGEEAVMASEQGLKKRGKDAFQKLLADHEGLRNQLRACTHLPPESPEAQALIAQHYRLIRELWGTSHLKDPQADAYKGLGQLFLQDERFTSANGVAQPAFAGFLAKAMDYYSDTMLRSFK